MLVEQPIVLEQQDQYGAGSKAADVRPERNAATRCPDRHHATQHLHDNPVAEHEHRGHGEGSDVEA